MGKYSFNNEDSGKLLVKIYINEKENPQPEAEGFRKFIDKRINSFSDSDAEPERLYSVARLHRQHADQPNYNRHLPDRS